jgi:hypothetical protein
MHESLLVMEQNLQQLHSFKYENTIYTTEGFGQAIVRFFGTIVDAHLKILNNFKTSIFQSYRDLKRTELIAYYESHMTRTKYLLNNSYSIFRNVEVPYPDKMVSTYPEAVVNTLQLLQYIDMKDRTTTIYNGVMEMTEAWLGGQTYQRLPEGITSQELKRVTDLFMKNTKIFSGKLNQPRTFGELFPRPTDMKTVFEQLTTIGAPIQYAVASVLSDLEKINAQLEKVYKLCQSGHVDVNKSSLTALADVTFLQAKLFDMYGVTVQDLTRLDHNLVEIFKTLKEHE